MPKGDKGYYNKMLLLEKKLTNILERFAGNIGNRCWLIGLENLNMINPVKSEILDFSILSLSSFYLFCYCHLNIYFQLFK